MLLTLKCEMNLETGEPLDELLPSCIDWLSSLGCSATSVSEAVREIDNNPLGAVASAIEDGIQR